MHLEIAQSTVLTKHIYVCHVRVCGYVHICAWVGHVTLTKLMDVLAQT